MEIEEDEAGYFASNGARVLVDPLKSVAHGRHPDKVHAYHKPYEATVIGFHNGLYQVVDDDGTMRPAEPDWLSSI